MLARFLHGFLVSHSRGVLPCGVRYGIQSWGLNDSRGITECLHALCMVLSVCNSCGVLLHCPWLDIQHWQVRNLHGSMERLHVFGMDYSHLNLAVCGTGFNVG